MVEINMTDFEFAKYLKGKGWKGQYSSYPETKTIYYNDPKGKLLATVVCNNETCTRVIFIPEWVKYNDLSEEVKKRIISMANDTWDAIGDDILQGMDKKKEIKRNHLVEIIMDADHMRLYGRDKEIWEVYEKLTPTAKRKIIKEAFPYKTYGY